MSPDRNDLHDKIRLTTDHSKAFAESILELTPTISKRGSELVLAFDEPEQAADALDLLWHAINSVKPTRTTKEE